MVADHLFIPPQPTLVDPVKQHADARRRAREEARTVHVHEHAADDECNEGCMIYGPEENS